jgi:tetratricopeptide (TPR) repeat protein
MFALHGFCGLNGASRESRALRPCGQVGRPVASLLAAALLLSAVLASPARAQTGDAPSEAAPSGDDAAAEDARREAGVHFTDGVELFEEGEYEGALIEFRQAYDTLPSPTVLYNIGQTYLAMRRYVEAEQAFRLYLERSGTSISSARAEDVQARLASLERRIGVLRISVNVEGAEVLLDGASLGAAPLPDPIRVDIGEHRVSARADGYHPTQVTVMVAGREEQDVAIELVASSRPEPAVVVAPAAPAASSSHPLRIAAWTLFGGAVALSGVTGWSTAQAFQGDQDYRAHPTEQGYLDGRRSVNRTYGLAAGSAALGVTALVLGLVAHARYGDEDEPPPVAFDVAPDRVGVTLFQSF